MNCLCCGKPLKEEHSEAGWHKSCIKKFFSTTVFPEIEISDRILKALVYETTSKGYTVAGVQKKLSLHLFSEAKKPKLTLVNYPTGYILKPQVQKFTALPQAEHLVMSMADKTGIVTVPHALIKSNNEYAYITKRVDRSIERKHIKMLAMEDFCQLDLRLTEDKYKGSYERCAKIIQRYSEKKGFDLSELFLRLVFCFVTGNSDMHLKNFSLIETDEGSDAYILSPAYDLLPVNIVMPEDQDQLALTMNGKKRNLRKKDFFIFADPCKMTEAQARKIIAKVISMKSTYIKMTEASLLPTEMKERMIQLIEERSDKLQ